MRLFVPIAGLGLWLIATLVACAGDDVADDTAVRAAMKDVESADTWFAMVSNGDGYSARVALLEAGGVPGLDVLLDDEAAGPALMEALRDGGAYEDDSALTVYAYVLGKRGDGGALEALADFLEASWYLELYISPHAATDSIFALLSDPRRKTDTYHYSLEDQDAAVAAARAGSASSALESGEPPLCHIKYTLVDANGNPLTYVKNGQTLEASITCGSYQGDNLAYAQNDKSQATLTKIVNRVTNGGGSYVPTFDGGQPSKRYNCAGYAFREFTQGDSLECDAPTMFEILTMSGALAKVAPLDPKQIGDKVFFSAASENGKIKHVAEVQETNLVGATRIRAPDNHSGVFDADINAPYFKSDNSWDDATYRWTNGPPIVKTSDGTGDPRYCSEDECLGLCIPDEEVCLDGACQPKTAQTSCELREPSCCPGQDNSCTAPDALCYCDDYCQEVDDCCPDVCATCGYCG